MTRARALVAQLGVVDNPYLAALRDGSMSLEEFRRTQEQFYSAVVFFPRPMAALMGRIPEPAARLDILRNLVEEHGDYQPARFHQTTFRDFLARIGARAAEVDQLAVWPCVRAFNSVLLTACLHDELEVGVGCMGVIELAFAAISAALCRGIIARGWLPEARLVHYSLHAEIDTHHAREFFQVVEGRWDDPARAYYLERGLELGAFVFQRLYRDLLEAGAR